MAQGWVSPLRRLARAALVSYAQVLFSGRPLAGLFFLLASFAADPFTGAVGLVAVLSANLTALRVWHDRIRWELGLAGYNAVLLGLALGHFLPHGRLVFLLAVVGGVVSALATEWLSHRFSKLSLPVLGLPFLAFAWLVIVFAGTGRPPAHWSVTDPLARYLPTFVADTVRVFGSAFFSSGVISGLLVLAGLLAVSRISAAVALGGALVAALLNLFVPAPELSINLVIVPIGLVFFLAPGRRMLWQLPAGVALTALLAFALDVVVGVTHLPYLILPLTLTLFAVLLLGRYRAPGVDLVPVQVLRSPEDHFRALLNRPKPVLRLPFFGTWFVSQGVAGGETHRDRLAHAWDFMVRDERGRTFGTPGYRLADYHAFGLQVCAPAAGRVVAVESAVPDNPPGTLNREQNWGNYVVVEHGMFEYSILAHLRQWSVRVKAGAAVSPGTVVGLCGNSGYSGQPHLHCQLQSGPLPGSDALDAEFTDYIVVSSTGERFVHRGIPAQGETVMPLLPQDAVRRRVTAGFESDSVMTGSRTETWKVSRGPVQGDTVLSCGPTRVSVREMRNGLAILKMRGSRATALGRTFDGIEFIPFYSRPGLEFTQAGRQHKFGRRAALASGADVLLLETTLGATTRRIWFAMGVGIARVEWQAGGRETVVERATRS
jgi:urea transporter